MANLITSIKTKVINGKKEVIYNLLVIIGTWLLFILINLILWEKIIDFLFSNSLFYIYIIGTPVLVTILINKLLIKLQTNKKYIVFGIVLPLILYYLAITSFIFLALQAFNNSSFPF